MKNTVHEPRFLKTASKAMLLFLSAALVLPVMSFYFNKPATLYVKIAAVYEGVIDKRFYMTRNALDSSAESFIGDTVLVAHEQGEPMSAVGIITKSATRYDEKLKLYYLEVIVEITDPIAIDKVQKRLFNKVSIGFMPVTVQCSICQNNMLHCNHDPANVYNGVLARGIIWVMEGWELSFVNIPASEHARVLSWSSGDIDLSEE